MSKVRFLGKHQQCRNYPHGINSLLAKATSSGSVPFLLNYLHLLSIIPSSTILVLPCILFFFTNNNIADASPTSPYFLFNCQNCSPVLFIPQNSFLINLNNTVMKQFYSDLLLLAIKKTLLLFIVFFGAYYVSSGQIYYGTLSGPNEFPTNSSPGAGKFVITIDGAIP